MWDDTRILTGSNEDVKKYVFSNKTAVAEAVLYKYQSYEKRTVICCSTQSGCPIGCRFCGAGDYFVRTLSEQEIFSQPVRLLNDTGVDPQKMERLQIMFMSMGEPMLALNSLMPAIRSLHFHYPKAALLVSTSGPKVDYEPFRNLSVDVPTVGLQFSVHESTDEARNKLIPFKNKLTLQEIAAEGEKWFEATGRTPFFNYCVHDKNDKQEDADRIAALFKPDVWQATISVICERDEHVAAANARQKQLADDFRFKLGRKGFQTRVFDPAGQDDIGGGCGQLWFVQDWMRSNPDKAKKTVGHGREVVHTPKLTPTCQPV